MKVKVELKQMIRSLFRPLISVLLLLFFGLGYMSAQISTTLYAGENNNGRDTIEICMSITNVDTVDWVLDAGQRQIIVVQFGDAPINGDNTADASCLVSTDFIVTSGSVDASISASSVSTANSDDVDFEVAFTFVNDLVLNPGESLELFCGQNSRITGSCENLVFLLDCSGTQFTIFNNGAIRPRGSEECTEGFAQQCNPNRPNAMSVRLEKEDPSCPDIDNGMITGIVDGGEPNFRFDWSTGDTTNAIRNLGAGFYSLTVTDGAGCTNIAAIDLSAGPAMMITFDQTPECPGFSDGSATANVTNGTAPYTYAWDATAANQTNTIAENLSAGSYNVTVSDSEGCSSIASVTIESITADPIDVACIEVSNSSVRVGWPSDPTIDSYEVNVDGLGWNASSGQSTHFVSGLTEEQVVTIEVRGLRSCSPMPMGVTDCIAFEFDANNSITVGNIFSPNGDDINDVLIADGRPGVLIYEFKIYDSWGNLSFLAENFNVGDSDFGWDGRINNEDAVIGVYTYTVIALLPNGEEVMKVGDVTLIR